MVLTAPKVILLAKRGSTSPCSPSSQRRGKLKIAEPVDFQSFGKIHKVFALREYLGVFYTLRVNLGVFLLFIWGNGFFCLNLQRERDIDSFVYGI